MWEPFVVRLRKAVILHILSRPPLIREVGMRDKLAGNESEWNAG